MWIRKKRVLQQAWCLGAGSEMQRKLEQAGLLREFALDCWKVYSREAPVEGEEALIGDFIKVDSGGYPYPVDRLEFLETHLNVEGDMYLQVCPTMYAWTADEPKPAVIENLLSSGRLTIHPTQPGYHFQSTLYGATIRARRDALVVLPNVVYDYNREADVLARAASMDLQYMPCYFLDRREFEENYVEYVTVEEARRRDLRPLTYKP